MIDRLTASVLRDKRHFFAEFTPRAEYDGRPVIPELLRHAGAILKCRLGWQMTEGDPYPGEWAVISASDDPDLLGRAWLASGDLTLFMCPSSSNLLHSPEVTQ
jgi:hypothetical protein